MIIDGNGLILGRLGTFVAKKALNGEKIDIVNSENIIITGKRDFLLKKYKQRLKRGIPAKGPFTYRMPHMFVKRAIRGMLPYKRERGKKAYKNIKCHIGIPDNIKKEEIISIDNANVKKLHTLNYLKVKTICKEIGAKI